jgi:lysozyme
VTNSQKILLGLLTAGVIFMASIKISKAGINKIKRYEALRLNAYQDSVGKWTTGYGHLILPNEDYLMTGAITETQAENLLKNDLAKVEKVINGAVQVPITGNQYDALVSLVFNIGAGNFMTSTLLKKLNEGDYEGAAAEFPRWSYADGKQLPGLMARRANEQNVFIS